MAVGTATPAETGGSIAVRGLSSGGSRRGFLARPRWDVVVLGVSVRHCVYSMYRRITHILVDLPVTAFACAKPTLADWTFDVDEGWVHGEVVADRVLRISINTAIGRQGTGNGSCVQGACVCRSGRGWDLHGRSAPTCGSMASVLPWPGRSAERQRVQVANDTTTHLVEAEHLAGRRGDDKLGQYDVGQVGLDGWALVASRAPKEYSRSPSSS